MPMYAPTMANNAHHDREVIDRWIFLSILLYFWTAMSCLVNDECWQYNNPGEEKTTQEAWTTHWLGHRDFTLLAFLVWPHADSPDHELHRNKRK